MDKQEFVDRLRMALNGRVSPGLVMDNVNYYEDYINTEIRKGRTEEEVLESSPGFLITHRESSIRDIAGSVEEERLTKEWVLSVFH